MQKSRVYSCAICGEEKPDHDSWFLLAENTWEDKLKILQWNERLAKSLTLACSSAHVEELVIHWMTTGSLDYPFARTSTRPRWRSREPWRASCDLDMTGARQIGELAVDREGMERVLSESPQSLQTILDALMDALAARGWVGLQGREIRRGRGASGNPAGGLEFECDPPLQGSGLLGKPDLPHAAFAEFFHQPIGPD
jgi:hypothetical protein